MARKAQTTTTQAATPQILLDVMARRKQQGLKVVIQKGDGEPFIYWPATEEQKADFLRRALKGGATILES